jgi:hypothetical protein
MFNKKEEENNVDYINFMYSDKYDKNDTVNVHQLLGKYYMNISIYEAIKRFGGNNGNWVDIVKFVGKWYEENIHTYQGSVTKTPNFGNMMYDYEINNNKIKVRDDCSGFVTACVLSYILPNNLLKDNFELQKIILSWATSPPSSKVWDSISNNTADVNNLKKVMESLEFEEIPYSFEKIQPFDIIAGNDSASGNFHHTEIYAGNDNGVEKSWSWGNIHDKSHGGMPAKFVSPNNNISAYKTIWRIKGLEKITDTKILFS